MKTLWLIAAGLGAAGTAAYLISRQNGNTAPAAPAQRKRKTHLTSAFAHAKHPHTEE